jgi:hypothetical protein
MWVKSKFVLLLALARSSNALELVSEVEVKCRNCYSGWSVGFIIA